MEKPCRRRVGKVVEKLRKGGGQVVEKLWESWSTAPSEIDLHLRNYKSLVESDLIKLLVRPLIGQIISMDQKKEENAVSSPLAEDEGAGEEVDHTCRGDYYKQQLEKDIRKQERKNFNRNARDNGPD